MSNQTHSLTIHTFVASVESNQLIVNVQRGELDGQPIDRKNKLTIKMDPYATWLFGEMVEALKTNNGQGFGEAPTFVKAKR